MSVELDRETIETPVGDYTVVWYYDECPDKPYNEGLGFAFVGGHNVIDAIEGAHAGEVLAYLNDRIAGWHPNGCAYYKWSSAGIARYLRIAYGIKGVREVDSNYQTSAPTTDLGSHIDGIAWAPDDVSDDRADDCTDAMIAEYRAWAHGDCFGWTITGPDGELEDGCAGYYGFADSRDYTLSEARDAAYFDADQRIEKSNLVGSGIIGMI